MKRDCKICHTRLTEKVPDLEIQITTSQAFQMIYTVKKCQLSKFEGFKKLSFLSRKGPDTVRSLSAGQRAQRPSPIVSNEVKTQSIIFEPECYSQWSSWPVERFLTVSGPFLDVGDKTDLRLYPSVVL